MRPITRPFTFLLIITFIAIIQVACEVPTGQATPTPEQVADCATINDKTNEGNTYEMPTTAYVDREIILTGNPVDIARVLAEIPEFEEIRTQPPCGTVDIQFDAAQLEAAGDLQGVTADLQSRLYPLPDNLGLWPAVEKIYEAVWNLVRENPENPPIVFADPNYILGYDVDGDPSNGHSGIGGTAVGSPAALPAAQLSAHEAAFWDQWAFGPAGIEINNGSGGRNPALPTGKGTTIVIFDTSPLPAGDRTLGWVTPPLVLEVTTPVPVPANAAGGDETVRQHGVYAAGLAHAVAPESEKVLVRVLNDTAQGDLFSLMRAIADYTNNRPASPGPDKLVYNFSLGINPLFVEVFPDDVSPETILMHIEDLIAGEVPEYAALLGDGSLELQMMPIPTLHSMFINLHGLGITTVAAAGNDSDDENIVYTQRPAAYAEVIAVAASDVNQEPACYTNIGQLAAPGGSGDTGQGCLPETVTNFCRTNEDIASPACRLALISMVTETKGLGTPNSFAYWIGTSFSTPMVSGLSALLRATSPSPLSPDDVSTLLDSGSTSGTCLLLPLSPPGTTNQLGVGIISVPRTLDNLNNGTCP